MKRAMLLGMVGLCCLGWFVTGKALLEKPAAYQRLMQEAEQYEADRIYVRAIETYEKALAYKPDSVDIKARIATDYLALGSESTFINRCNSINSAHHYPVSVVTLLADYYIENGREKNAADLLGKAMKVNKNNEELAARWELVRYSYSEFYENYSEIFSFRNDSAVVKEEELYGLINVGGNSIMRAKNEWNGVLSSERDMVPVYKDGEFYYANDNGYRIEVPQDGQKIEELGVLCGGMAPAKSNGKYGYINAKFEELSGFLWDGATVIQNGFGAVAQGGKWALVNSKLELVTDFIYDDVIRDDYGYCSIAGRAFVKVGDGYQMVDEKGVQVGTDTYQDAVPFVGDEPTAVKIGGKWGFVSVDGEMVIEPQYEGGGAFSNGLAPVQTLSGWGYIDSANKLVIADQFLGARSFYKGVAPVKKGNRWCVISLNVK